MGSEMCIRDRHRVDARGVRLDFVGLVRDADGLYEVDFRPGVGQ